MPRWERLPDCDLDFLDSVTEREEKLRIKHRTSCRKVWYTIVLYCDNHGEIVDGGVLTWPSEDDAYAYLFACKEDDKYFADGAVVEKPPCLSCRWRCHGHEGDPASYCRNDEAPSPYREAACWGGLPGCPQYEDNTNVLELSVRMEQAEVAEMAA